MEQRNTRRYSTEIQNELRNNPYTFSVSECRIVFTLAFKQLLVESLKKPGMTPRKVFELAGYDSYVFTRDFISKYARRILEEASSPGGLKEPVAPKKPSNKKRLNTEVAELQKRVENLEQQLAFLKKTEHIRKTKMIPLPSISDSYTKP